VASLLRKFDVSFFRTLTAQGRVASGDVLSEEIFHGMIARERKRSERSQRPFVLLLIDSRQSEADEDQGRLLLDLLPALQGATRETDVTGWYKTDAVVGVMFTEIVLDNKSVLRHDPFPDWRGGAQRLDTDQFSRVTLPFTYSR